MKIVMLQDFFGVNLSYQENLLTEYYIKAGHEVVVITSTFESVFDYINNNYNTKLSRKEFIHKGAKIIRLPYQINIINKLRKHADVYSILELEKPDLIFLHNIHLNIKESVRYKKNNPNCKIIMDYHADYSNSAKDWISLNILHKIIRKKILYKNINYIDKFYPVTPSCEEFLNEVYDVPSDKMEILPLGYDADLSNEIKNKVNCKQIRKQFGINENDFVIITGGKLEPAKKTDYLIDALKILQNDKIHIIVFGDSREGCESFYQKLILKSENLNVHFTGWLNINEILTLMAISNIAIYPASQSVIWQQSIGMNLPLIVGNSGSQDAEYLNKENNLICMRKEEINPENIANIIKKIFSDPQLENSMRKGAQKVATEHLDYRVLCNKTLNVFNTNTNETFTNI